MIALSSLYVLVSFMWLYHIHYNEYSSLLRFDSIVILSVEDSQTSFFWPFPMDSQGVSTHWRLWELPQFKSKNKKSRFSNLLDCFFFEDIYQPLKNRYWHLLAFLGKVRNGNFKEFFNSFQFEKWTIKLFIIFIQERQERLQNCELLQYSWIL